MDTSEMQTTYDKGKCDKDGTTIWLTDGFEKNIIHWGDTDWICDSCDDVPSSGYGEDGSDLCNNGKNNEHGGWKRTGHMAAVVYVTIGDLSRDPNFPAAKDVNYDKVGNYDSVSDSETTESMENQEETETAAE